MYHKKQLFSRAKEIPATFNTTSIKRFNVNAIILCEGNIGHVDQYDFSTTSGIRARFQINHHVVSDEIVIFMYKCIRLLRK